GWLARMDLRSRPVPAGPMLRTPGAQCLGEVAARISLALEEDGAAEDGAAWDAELGLRAVIAGPEPLLAPGDSLLAIAPRELRLSALKPADDGDGVVLRLLNSTDREIAAVVRTGFRVEAAALLRLDETPLDVALEASAREGRLPVPPHHP